MRTLPHLIALVALILPPLAAETARYRLAWREDPATSVAIIWEQLGGGAERVHYDRVDHGTDPAAYAHSATPARTYRAKGMETRAVRLTGLQPDTAYYFVVADDGGASQRMWFRTAPATRGGFTLIAGGDTRNNRSPRRAGNVLVAKLRPLGVLIGGDLTDRDTDAEWQEWFDDWQSSLSDDGRMYPVLVAEGNHDSNASIHELFDTPHSLNHFAVDLGGDLLRVYTLNSEITEGGEQGTWLAADLAAHAPVFRLAQYHKPMRPHVSGKSEGNAEYAAWAQLFFDYGMDLVVECDSHTAKRTWPIRPSSEAGHDEGFVRDDENGTVYIGEGCWGAPLRSADDAKSWTAASRKFNQFNWIHVHPDRIEVRTVDLDGSGAAASIDDADPFAAPAGLQLWEPASGTVLTIRSDHASPTITAIAAEPNPSAGTSVILSVTAEDADGDLLSYSWSTVSKPTGSQPVIGGGEDPTVTFDEVGDYRFRVTVDDGRGGSVSDEVTVSVQGSASSVILEP